MAGSLYFLGKLKETSFEYTPEGALKKTTYTLNHTLPLQRFHELAGAVIAQPPSDASADGTFVAENKYTTLGNLERETAPNNRCRDVTYDPAYETLATVETIYTGGCGVGALATGAAYDRGFGLVTTVVELSTRQTRVAYDAFGRLSQLTRPHPTTLLALSPKASVKVEYFLPPDLGSTPTKPVSYSLIHTSTHDGEALSDDAYLESWSYVDGLGRTLVTLSEADPSLPSQGGDGAQWVASGQVVFDGKGALQRKYLESYYAGTAKAFPFAVVPSTPYGTQTYDAFGRQITTTDLDGTVTLYSSYHALSTDMWDAADLSPGPHQGTFASERKDGHGRTRATLERFHEGATLRTRETLTQYLPTGEPQAITRQLVGTTEKVVRWMRYDSQGRLVLNVEPNTSENFTDQPTSLPANLRAWRYAYNDAGDLVGTSDARGCGVNFAYDGAGRLTSEDYSPCRGSHAVYSQPNLGARTGFEVLYHYDTAPPEPLPTGINLVPGFIKGRLVATYDRASLTVTEYDGRGRTPKSAVRIAKPGPVSDALATRYAERWYLRSMSFDGADREIAATTGASVAELMGSSTDGLTNDKSTVRTAYTKRGTVKHVKSTYGDLVNRAERTADGLLQRVEYGDATHTTTDFSYDVRRRVKTVQTYRGPPAGWNAPNNQPTFQLLLQDDELTYDSVGNPTEIRDWRIASEWPAGAKPVTKKAQYDDLYRVSRVDYQYEGGDDTWTSPFAAENGGQTDLQDPRRAKPSPHVDFAKRLQWQTFSYDWLGNTSKTDDDAHGFYDRSLGPITNDASKPYQLKSADNTSLGGGKTGKLAAQYDASGNLARMHVQRAGTCLPANSDCSQVYDYQWDEVGRLARARRWDVTTLPPMSDLPPDADLAADLRYGYDAGDQRVIKTAVDDALNERHTVYVFESLELRRAVFAPGSGPSEVPDYELSKWTEVPYLYAHGVRLARVAWNQPELPTVGGKQLHVLLELGDHLGSTSVVLDQATGELVERGTYQAYGGAESDYRPERWKGFREDYRFTGKEEDVEVGLQYFGKRYYAPLLNRWVSADPLTIHALGSDLNVYAYVRGAALKATDPLGLDETTQSSEVGNLKDQELAEQMLSGGGSSPGAKPAAQSGGDGSPPLRAVPRAPPSGSGGAAGREKGGYGGAVPNPESDPYIDQGGPVFSHEERSEFVLSLPHHQGLAMSTPERAPDYLGHSGRRAAAFETGRMSAEIGLTAGSLVAGPGFLGEAAMTQAAPVLRFSQVTASPSFSEEGTFAGKTIGQLVSELRAGSVSASDVPVGYVTTGEGTNLIVNTRSSLALRRAGIPQSEWNLVDQTATELPKIQERLIRNQLTPEGTRTLRITGMGKNASSLE
ncbi:MAG: RHS repeat-associated core domain-containing protein [Myxococcales bacterium]|nr:RHS repeat-associated core domain-containing protein [Myxococcales bacterium]